MKLEFNAKAVQDRVEAAKPNALSKAGAFIWRRARSSLSVAKNKFSSPGQPPKVRSRSSPLYRLTKFAVDRGTSSVVIGPEAFGNDGAPVIEAGGQEKVTLYGKTEVQASYKPRPWMGPALETEIAEGTLPKAWEGEVHA